MGVMSSDNCAGAVRVNVSISRFKRSISLFKLKFVALCGMINHHVEQTAHEAHGLGMGRNIFSSNSVPETKDLPFMKTLGPSRQSLRKKLSDQSVGP